jgi:hypothetical protein
VIDFTTKTSRKANDGAIHKFDVSYFRFSLRFVPWAGETVYQPSAISASSAARKRSNEKNLQMVHAPRKEQSTLSQNLNTCSIMQQMDRDAMGDRGDLFCIYSASDLCIK